MPGAVPRSGKVIGSARARKFGSSGSRTGAGPRQSVLEEEVIPVPRHGRTGGVSSRERHGTGQG